MGLFSILNQKAQGRPMVLGEKVKDIKLYDYFRSSAAFRVRIALNLKGVDYEQIPINLREAHQKSDAYKAVNPLGLVPALHVQQDMPVLTQSLAIIEYLDELIPEPPFLSRCHFERAQQRAFAQSIACDIHPLNNLRVLNYLKDNLGIDDLAKQDWYHHWITEAFQHLEYQVIAAPYAFGKHVSLADIVLIPQIVNAQRFELSMQPYPRLMRVFNACMQLDAFQKASPTHNS